MGTIKLLDCTLRDGGYINNWNFGKDAICDITKQLEVSNSEIVELGFLRNEPYNPDLAIFNDIKQATALIGERKAGREYAVMAEVSNPLPLDMLSQRTEEDPEIIRIIVWKRTLQEGYDYCKGIIEKGYKLCVQPARVSQYSDQEFIDMINMFNDLNPLAIYVVDSWGTMYKDTLLHYLELADKHLNPGISVGYHGHNNMMQAFDVASAFVEKGIERDMIIDASVFGIGRGAGNLNSEIFAKYMNEKHGKDYNLSTFTDIFDKYISKIYETCKWGYSVPFLISAKYNCNPDFVSYFEEKGCSGTQIEKIILAMTEDERIIYSKEKAEKAMEMVK